MIDPYLKKFKDKYNKNNQKINNNLLSNILIKWNQKFNEFRAFDNPQDNQNRKNIYIEIFNKKETVLLDKVI